MSINSSSSLPILSRTFLKNDVFLVILCLSFSANTFGPLIDVTVYGVIVKFVENLFCLFCFTNTVSPLLLAFVPRRLSAYPFLFVLLFLGFLLLHGVDLLPWYLEVSSNFSVIQELSWWDFCGRVGGSSIMQ